MTALPLLRAVALTLSTAAACLASAGTAAAQDPRLAPPLKVMTFNIRYGTAKDDPHHWPARRALVEEVIHAQAPHVLGVQEALAFQMEQLGAALPEWRSLGVGREGGTKGEFSALFVDERRLEVLEHGTFWLSETPDEVGSKSWDAALPRICTWALLRDRENDEQLRVLNTHFDHRGAEARKRSAQLIAARVAEFDGPVVVMGDLNADEGSAPLTALMTGRLRDSFRAIHPDAAPVGTFTDFEKVVTPRKIDHVLATDGLTILDAGIVRHQRNGHFPSDHLPVTATLGWPWPESHRGGGR